MLDFARYERTACRGGVTRENRSGWLHMEPGVVKNGATRGLSGWCCAGWRRDSGARTTVCGGSTGFGASGLRGGTRHGAVPGLAEVVRPGASDVSCSCGGGMGRAARRRRSCRGGVWTCPRLLPLPLTSCPIQLWAEGSGRGRRLGIRRPRRDLNPWQFPGNAGSSRVRCGWMCPDPVRVGHR